MSIKKFFATKDNTITDAFGVDLRTRGTLANQGASDVMEVFSIYGQSDSSSVERARSLVQFSVKDIKDARDLGQIKESGKANFYFRLFNAAHNTTTPRQYDLSIMPLLDTWSEGRGLDMETYKDLGASNWVSSSQGSPWAFEGSSYSGLVSSRLTDPSSAHIYTAYFNTGKENLQVQMTDLVESWLLNQEGNSVAATASVTLGENPANDQTQKITLYSYSGFAKEFIFSTSSLVNGDTHYVEVGAGITQTRDELITQILSSSLFTATSDGASSINLTQVDKGLYGNTIIEVSGSEQITKQNFAGGTGTLNRGLIVKLSGSAESGGDEKTYYTKRFFARNSQYFFKKPTIEVRSETIIEDDRGCFIKSSSLAPASDNLNKIYLYNLSSDGDYVDIPSTGSSLSVTLVSALGQTPETISGEDVNNAGNRVTATREQEGVYSVSFAYAGSESKLYDIWSTTVDNETSEILTGSGFSVNSRSVNNSNVKSGYKFNITNLKSSYTKDETYTFRVHTLRKGQPVTVYTKATNKVEVSNVKEAYFKIDRVTDNFNIIPYTEDDDVKYSKLSYDMSGSFFDLDMSILAPNYLYEISFLRKSGKNYIEQDEKFRFRIEK